jgi:hypothetical protein
MDQFSHNLSSASPDEAKSALRALLNAFPLAAHEDMRQVIATYVMAIDGYCLAAIQKAVLRFIRGEVVEHDGKYMPTPAQLSREVKYRHDLMTPPPSRLSLPAPKREEPTEEERARVASRVRQWVKEREPEPVALAKPREPGDIVRQMRSENLKLSPAILATFVQSPDELYDEWEQANPPTPNKDARAA